MKLSDFNVLDETASQDVVEGFNRTRRDYPRDRAIADLFSEQAALNPQAVAVIQGGTRLSYGELERRANRLARLLLARGLGPETLAGIMLDRSPAMLVAMLGVLKAGGAYFPLNHDLPEARLRWLLKDSRAPLVVSAPGRQDLCRRLRDACPGLKDLVYLDDVPERREDEWDASDLDTLDDTLLPSRSRPDNLAYVIYTSGTTGQPKGVMVAQRPVLRLVLNTNFIHFGPEDRILQTGSLAFDASTLEIWGALLNGACLCLPGESELLDAAGLARLIRRHGVTALFLTTGLFNALAADDPGLFANVGTVLCGGEKASAHHFNQVLGTHPGLTLVNGYGPTENTTFTCCQRVREPCRGEVPIGPPIANTTVYILDRRLRPVDIGIPGELYAGGDGLARGYWGRPGLTAAAFVPHPFAPGQRLYRSGDQARWRADGAAEYLGRLDHQVKIRGYRIEPAEIEARLLEHPAIKEAVVTVRESAAGERELVAYYTRRRSLDGAELRRHLQEKLPEYMVPPWLLALERLPLNPNGKVDRRALPDPRELAPSRPGPAPSLSATEGRLLAIWEEVLERPVGPEEDFFELGGHSLKATRLASLIQQRLGLSLPFTAVFQAPTVRTLAQRLLDAARFGVEGIDSPVVLLNGCPQGRPLFAFPPATADALGYGGLAGLLSPYACYGCNFIESDSRLADYAALIAELDPQGPHLLLGYSGGGNLAFQVAGELERRGRRVAAVVMLDSARMLRPFPFPEGEAERVAAQFLDTEAARSYLTSPVLRDKAMRNICRYYDYFATLEDRHRIAGEIHLLLGEDSQDSFRDEQGRLVCQKSAWAEATSGVFCRHRGHGAHNQMLFPPYLEANGALLRGLLEALDIAYPWAGP